MARKTKNKVAIPVGNIGCAVTLSKTVSAVVRFTPMAIKQVYEITTPYFARHHRELSKSDAVNMLLEKMPQQTIDEIISTINNS